MRRRAFLAWSPNRAACGGADRVSAAARAVARPLDFRACVHDDVEAGIQRASGCIIIDHAKLEPYAPRADRDRLVDMPAGMVRATEDVDDIDRKVDVSKVGVTILRKY